MLPPDHYGWAKTVRFLVFDYTCPISGGQKRGLVLMDLKMKEYRHIPKGTFFRAPFVK